MKISGFFISVIFIFLSGSCNTGPPEKFIAVNLVGYNIDQPKKALLVNAGTERFEVIRAEDSEVVYSGVAGEVKEPDAATGDKVTVIDFSEFKLPGEYLIRSAEDRTVRSTYFRIAPDIYNAVTRTVLQSYYYHRCGTSVGNGKPWAYDACHLDDAPFYGNPDSVRNVTGGWHDAGDYNKFSVNTALSAGLLLYLYEKNPAIFADRYLDIPESGNGIPDLLDEVSRTLRWLMKMQRSDGGIYHKVSQKKWVGEFLPHEDTETRYLFEVSSGATAGFAAVAALGARLLEKINPDFSEELKISSLSAWSYLEKHPGNVPEGGFTNPSDVIGGDYGDPDDSDERLWAAAELYRLTSDDYFLDYFSDKYESSGRRDIPPVSWKNVQSLVFKSFLKSDLPDSYANLEKIIRDRVVRHADSILAVQEQNNYLNLIHHSEYYWGSNSVGLAYALDLLHAHELTTDQTYRNSALYQLH
ncbi:MAG: glycoside hydrolase family 9 protein, partial [Balneolaceae bacterium]